MHATDLKKGLQSLDELAHEEYKESLEQIINNEADDAQLQLEPIGRLLGVILKMSFATCDKSDIPSSRTRAYREWNLVEESEFYTHKRQRTPEYRALEAIFEEVQDDEYWVTSVYALAHFVATERGFFWLCGGGLSGLYL